MPCEAEKEFAFPRFDILMVYTLKAYSTKLTCDYLREISNIRLADMLARTEAQALAQLRTVYSKLLRFLCKCSQGKEDTRHFFFYC